MAKTDKLTKIRTRAETVRNLTHEITDLEQRLKDKKAELFRLVRDELPDLMSEIGMDKIGLPAKGNKPAVDAVLRPFYSANIAVGWPEERRQAAFTWLEKNDAGDLIKTVVELAFPREQYERAKELVESLTKHGFKPQFLQKVHAKTLTAWLQEQIEQGHLPPLDVIGGEVGRIVVLQTRDA